MKRWRHHPHVIAIVSRALGLCLLGLLLLRLTVTESATPSLTRTLMQRSLPSGATPSERAVWEAQGWRLQAFLVADDEREVEEATDPGPLSSVEREASRRRRLIEEDRAGHLARALSAARRAAALARTPDEAARSAALRARLECYAGDHASELAQARRLVALAPGTEQAWMALRRAGRCMADEALVREAAAKLDVMAEPKVARDPTSAFSHDNIDDEPPTSDTTLCMSLAEGDANCDRRAIVNMAEKRPIMESRARGQEHLSGAVQD
jgi:hypothetical protein